MRTPEETIEFIDKMYFYVNSSPRIIGYSPTALEVVLSTLDSVRRFIVSAKEDWRTWGDYCEQLGVPADARFVEWFEKDWTQKHGSPPNEDIVYQSLCEHWMKYQKWHSGQQ